jgi:hypothetical protein
MAHLVLMLALAITVASCGRFVPRTTAADPTADVARLWEEPVDLDARDLYNGPGGPQLAPDPSTPFIFVAEDRSGYSSGYDVRDATGMLWSVKLGPEAQPEVAVSRLLWAIGYHQLPTYYLPTWQMTGAESGARSGGRFRPEVPEWKVASDWSWYDNDLLHTPAFRQLVVANVIVNNWDWKTSNNKVYDVRSGDGTTRRLYVVRDLGASLGKTSYPRLLAWFPMRGLGQGTRNDIEGFESQGFIEQVSDGRIDFDYRGIHQSLLDIVTPDDVARTCGLLARLTDAQLNDAFRAAGYSPDVRLRYVAKLKSKIRDGLQLTDVANLADITGDERP